MQKQIQSANESETQSSILSAQTISAEERELAKVMYGVNMLVQYPLQDEMIVLWAKNLHRIRGWVVPEHLQRTIDRFIIGDLEWDKSQGIQNIFTGLQRTPRDPNRKPRS